MNPWNPYQVADMIRQREKIRRAVTTYNDHICVCPVCHCHIERGTVGRRTNCYRCGQRLIVPAIGRLEFDRPNDER